VSSKQRWLDVMWSRVRSDLPAPPAVIVEVGCGSLGGFVPMLERQGYQALGIDPQAPEGPSYRRVEFEESDVSAPVDAVVACTSLHHVAYPAVVVDRIADVLGPDGTIVVVEWDWESFDEASARWGFERIDPGDEPSGWLHGARERWLDSGLAWDDYLTGWTGEHGLHGASALVRELDRRFDRVRCDRGAYLFSDLPETSEAEELSAIEAGDIRALRIDYVGRRR
jgi:SAM-dependent methyltransferase